MWEDTLSDRVIQQWQAQTGTTIHITYFDNSDDRDTLLTVNKDLPFDILILDNVAANIYGKLGELVDVSDLHNRQNNHQRWNRACGDHGQPYFWGSVGIVYRSDKIPHPPKKWRDFISPPGELSGHISLLNDSTDSFLPFLISRGISAETDNAHALKQSYSEMLNFNHHVLTYQYPLSFVKWNPNADQLYMGVAYSGDEHLLNRIQNVDYWRFTLPEDRPQIWLDCIAVSQHSNKKSLSKQFLNYLSDPKISAINATDVKAATTNVSALKLLPAWYLNDASLAADNENIPQGQIDSALSAENIRLRAKILSQLLNDHETQH
ncbi:extracellular solute-binding protein [Vibrio sp. 404]|uniref:Extracellular solute-binding protein n=2 Tax=Vibrio marinisediminis TaxID=2758441 RepID=A0A7W2FUJ2_9VIBR|nr:extracellular solute-binding protein [Vibrio marinisediminis]